MLAASFDLGGVLAGSVALMLEALIWRAPWILVMYPPLLQVRGIVNGALCGRLTTSLHTGLVYPKLRGNTEYFTAMVASTMLSASIGGLLVGSATLAGSLLVATRLHPAIALAIALCSSVLSICFTVPATLAVAIMTFRRGWDPDIFTYPVMSTFADVAVTASYATVVYITFLSTRALWLGAILAAVFTLIVAMRWAREAEAKRMLRENIAVMMPLAALGTVTGSILSTLREEILSMKGLLVVYPSLIDSQSTVGSIVGSLATTQLALGYMKPKLAELRRCTADIAAVFIAASVMYLTYGLIGSLVSGRMEVALVSLSAYLICFSPIVLITYLIAMSSFRGGWDPDALVNPAVSSLADLIMTAALAASLALLKAT